MTVARVASTAEASLAARILEQAQRAPDKVALVCDGEALTYSAMTARAFSLAVGMQQLGVRRGDHIGVALPNCSQFALLLMAAADLGAVVVPISPGLPAAAMARAFTATDVRHVVALRVVVQQLEEEVPAYMASLPGRVFTLEASAGAGNECSLDVLSQARRDPHPLELGRAEDPYILTMTSGSTGSPKPILFEQRTKLARAQATAALYRLCADERILAATPMYHSLAQRLTLMPLLLGATAVILPRFSAKQWLATLVEQQITFTIAVSSQLAQLTRQPNVQLHEHSALRCIVSSSAALPTDLKQRLCDLLRCAFHECYGTSETATATDLRVDRNGAPLDSVGLPLPGVKVRIVDTEGRDVEPGREGEIVCASPLLFAGYYKQPGITAAAFLDDAYFRTGDVGRLDANGYLYFRGRLKDVIITGGINVYPQDVEQLVNTLPWVAECAAFAVPDANLGESVALAVVPKPGQDPDLRGIRRLCAQQLADFQQPRHVVLMHALPRNEMGKVVRAQLANHHAIEHGAAHA